jgi:hypothetical protein
MLAGIALGIAVGAMFMLIAHLAEGIHPFDFWRIARAVGTIGAVVGAIVGLVWEFASGPTQPADVKPPAPTPHAPSESS